MPRPKFHESQSMTREPLRLIVDPQERGMRLLRKRVANALLQIALVIALIILICVVMWGIINFKVKWLH